MAKVTFQAIPHDHVSVHQLADDLRQHGAEEVFPLDTAGVVTGTINHDRYDALANVTSVKAIERGGRYRTQ